MPASTDLLFNPCSLAEAEQIPAKIWELLRRNARFRADVERLRKLDDKEHTTFATSGKYHGPAWEKSCALIRKVEPVHPFAHAALMWLVPEPLLSICRLTFARDGKRLREEVCPLRPHQLDAPRSSWPWRGEGSHQGWPTVRGPEVIHLTSNKRKHCDPVIFLNEWRGWKPEVPMFDCNTHWPKTPEGFRHRFMFLWRSRYDCRPDNPNTKNRHDSPHAHESDFFCGWNLAGFNLARDAARVFTFDDLAGDYRVFAVPKTVLTKGSARAIGKWLEDELKKGSSLYGDLLKDELLDEGDVLGANSDWSAHLQHRSALKTPIAPSGRYYAHVRHIKELAELVYPSFNVGQLLAPSTHRAHGKRYGRKCGTK